MQDISDGREGLPIRVVNEINGSMPESFTYITDYNVHRTVAYKQSKDFRVSCTCIDNCVNKFDCPCWQLTLEGLQYTDSSPDAFGYQYKRLFGHLNSGVFECNEGCQCNSRRCVNRVAQKKVQHRLELFKTRDRGWGVRCLDDIAKGSFICCYYGDLLSDKQTDDAAERHGDEYFAELDYIEKGEQFKEGYESSVEDDEDDAFCRPRKMSKTENLLESTERDNAIKAISYFPKNPSEKNVSETRRLFGASQDAYVIDGKRRGNIGRFFNVS